MDVMAGTDLIYDTHNALMMDMKKSRSNWPQVYMPDFGAFPL